MRLALLPLALLSLTACRAGESLHAYGAGGHIWHLVSIGGTATEMRATLEFPSRDRLRGRRPVTATVPHKRPLIPGSA